MKLLSGTFIFLLTFWFVNTASSQLISFSVHKEPLEKVFLLIEKQSGYNFIYSAEMLAKTSPVTLIVSNQPIEPVLVKCFAGQPLQYTLDEKHILVKAKVIEFNRELRGRIVNENGEPVAGVSVTIKNTSLATSSASNGEFLFAAAPESVTLIISGAEIEMQELKCDDRSCATVQVKSKLGLLDETVLIAYGKTTRRNSIGTVGKVTRDEIRRQPVSNILGTLSGRITGLQVVQQSGVSGSPFTIRLRGQNSIANGNDPLYIVDGIPFPSVSLNGLQAGGVFSSPLNTINISDIERVDVLKDAEATAIYGSRGANGVILITTRRGAEGKFKIEAALSGGVGKLTRLMDLLKTPDYLQMRREAFANDGIAPTTANAPDITIWDSTKNTNWQKELVGRTMQQSDMRIELSGGNSLTQFRTGFSYHKENTVLPLKSFGEEKIGGQVSLNHKTNNQRLQFSLQASLFKTKLTLPEAEPSSYIMLPPNAPNLHNPDGSLNWNNPVWGNAYEPLLRPFFSETNNILISSALTLRIVSGLEGKVSFGYNLITMREHSRTPKSSFNPAYNPVSSASFGQTDLQNLLVEPQLSYKTKWSKVEVQGLVGVSLQHNQQQGLQQMGSGYTSDELLNSIQAAATTISMGETDIRYRYAGFFARVTAECNHKYSFSLTGRRDGSSRYAVANRFANFGSMGVSWTFTREKWAKALSWLNFGKLKTSLGITGNDQIGDYKYLDTYSSYSYSYQGIIPFIPTQLYSPSYSWEKVVKREVALDMGIWKERLLVGLNYYHNTTGNQLVPYALPALTGFSSILQNLPARVSNYGWELELTGVAVRHTQFSWSIGINITIPKNKLERFDNLATSSYANQYVVGYPLFITKRYGFKGVDAATGLYSFVDVNRDGKISSAFDRQTIVFTGQQYFGGLQQSFTFRNISAGFLVQFVRQRNGGSYVNVFGRPGTFSNQPTEVMKRWTRAGDIRPVQRFSYAGSAPNIGFSNYINSDGSYDDASFIRLKNIYIGWQPFKSRGANFLLQQLSIQFTGQNLLTWTKYPGLDPETKNLLPPLRVLTAGIQLIL